MTDFTTERQTLRRAATLIRRLDNFLDYKLEEDGIPARVIVGDLLELANNTALAEAMDRVREVAAEDREHSTRVGSLDAAVLRLLKGGAA